MKLVIFSLICFEVVNLETTNFIHIIESKNYLFHKINFVIHTTMNKLLTSLNLNEGFMTSPNIEMLLSMHNYLERIAERNCRVYEKLNTVNGKNIGISGRNTYNDSILDDIVEEEIRVFKNDITNSTSVITIHDIQLKPDVEDNGTESIKTDEMVKKFNDLWTELGDKTIENVVNSALNDNYNLNFSELSDNTTDVFEVQEWTSQSEEELKTTDTRRIYRGKNAKIKNYPFVVSIHLMSEYLCAGSIISWDMVITAASCLQIAYTNKVFRNNPRTIFVRMGSEYPKHSGDLVPIVEVNFHPQYDPVTLKNNLAILKMLHKIKPNAIKGMKIQYDKTAAPLAAEIEQITIVGWGARSAKPNAKNLQKLAVAHLDIYDINDCKEVYSKYYVTDTNFCAGFTSKGGGACMGDVGGPAVVSVERELVGVVSFGPTVCGMTDAPTVFTKLGYYAEWINTVLNNQILGHKRDDMKPIIEHTTPETQIITLFTTAKTLFKSAPKHITGYTKTKDILTTKDYPEEMILLKKIIQDFVLGNETVLDYLTNAEIMKHESGPMKEQVFYDRIKPTFPKSDRNNNVVKKLNKRIGSTTNEKPHYTLKTTPAAEKPHSTDFDSTRYNTKKTTPIKVNQRVKHGFFYNYAIEPYRADESSSYYELDIPIDDAPFKPQPQSFHGYPKGTTPSVDGPRTTEIVTHRTAPFKNDVKSKSVFKDVIILQK